MKKFLTITAILLLLPIWSFAEKLSKLPDVFSISYQVKEQLINGEKSFVSRDQIKTGKPQVDAYINGLAEAYEEEMAPQLKKQSNPRRNSRLDIHIIHSVSGQSAMSFQVLARETHNRNQLRSPFQCASFDMKTGERITLTDLFLPDGEALDVIAEEIYGQLSQYFPAIKADEAALNALCTHAAILETPFMLGPVCISFHYEASILYPGKPSLMRVSIPYSAFPGMMTEYGALQMDNSMYKMVALTFDDGPAYTNTPSVINNLRYYGARGTFFIVGDRIAEYEDITLREHDENHSIQSHHFKHTDTTKSNVGRIQSYTKQFYEAITNLTGLAPIMLRPPYGLDEPFVQAKVNLPIIQWDVDTKDWTGKTPAAVLSVVKSETKDGSIILMHDIKDNTPEAAKQTAKWLREHGFLCVTVEELFMHFGQEMIPNRVYYKVEQNEEAL